MEQCSICLGEVRETRGNSRIRCGHLFHKECLESWKERGKHTCPVCRKVFDGTNFKVQLTIHNIARGETSNNIPVDSEFALDILDVFFDVSDLVDLESVLGDFGVGVTDLDPAILDTE